MFTCFILSLNKRESVFDQENWKVESIKKTDGLTHFLKKALFSHKKVDFNLIDLFNFLTSIWFCNTVIGSKKDY